MQRIIYVKSPFQKSVHPRALAPLSVVHSQNGDRQHDRHLQDSIHPVNGEEVNGGVNGHIEGHPKHLRLEIFSIRSERQDAKARDTAPIAGERDQANEQDKRDLPSVFDPLAVGHPQHHQSPSQGPHHAGLIQHVPVVERDQRMQIRKIHGRDHVRNMRNDGKGKQARRILMDILRVSVALRDTVAHDRASHPADSVQNQRQKLPGIPREGQPSNMVKGHSDDRNDLQPIRIQRGFHFSSLMGWNP